MKCIINVIETFVGYHSPKINNIPTKSILTLSICHGNHDILATRQVISHKLILILTTWTIYENTNTNLFVMLLESL